MANDLENRLRALADDYPSPDLGATAESRAAFLDAAARSRRRRFSRGRILRPALVAAGFVVCVGAAFGAGLTVGDERPPLAAEGAAGPGFLPAPGWNALNSGLTVPPQAPSALATNVELSAHDRETGGRPDETIRSLGPRGIALYATFIPAGQIASVDAQFPERELPLRLDDAIAAGIEGAPANGKTLRLLARSRGYDIDVIVFFGATTPSADVEATAGEQLARLVVPGCPAGTLAVSDEDRPEAAAYVERWLALHYLGRLSDLTGARIRADIIEDAPHGRAIMGECPDASGRMLEVQVMLSKQAQPTVGRFPLSYIVVREESGWTIWRQV